MSSIKARLTRLEQHQEQQEVVVRMYDGPPMTTEEIDAYNRNRGPDEPFLFTLRIDRREDARDLVLAEGEGEQ